MKIKGKLIIFAATGIIAGTYFVSNIISNRIFAEPGTDSDPLITLSYLEKRIEEVKQYVDNKTSGSDNSNSNKLEVIELQSGQRIIGKEGTEFILRSGRAVAKTSSLGGISDVTAGVDLQEGENIPRNHQLIIPRDDGRGLIVTHDSTFILVRGEYIIE